MRKTIIIPNDLDFVRDEIEDISVVYLDDEELEEQIQKSDIVMVVIDKNIHNFTQELYERIDKAFVSVYFKDIVGLNEISANEYEAIKKVQSLKKVVSKANVFDIEVLKEDLANKIAQKETALKIELKTTYLNAIKIKEYFSIKDMVIDDLDGNKEIYFVGENGDGKTVLLQAIALALKGDSYTLFAEDYIKNIKNTMQFSTKDTNHPDSYKKYKKVQNLFAYGINRNKTSSNEEETKITSYSGLFDTPSIYRTTLLRDPEEFLEQDTPLVNEFKKQMSFLMDEKFEIIKTDKGLKYGDIEQFSMLSEGYKTTLIWLSDLLSRLIENDTENKIIKLKEFQAIVLIDEVDLYLHPKWKYDFMHKLRNIFPNIQFIMTTHSLVTVLGASEDAVFYKVYKEGSITKVTNQISDISSYTANILLTSPIFNLDDMKARGFGKDERLSSDDYIYREIHTAIREDMKNNPSILGDELKQKVKDELQERLAKLRNR